jgi:hypothetical protein
VRDGFGSGGDAYYVAGHRSQGRRRETNDYRLTTPSRRRYWHAVKGGVLRVRAVGRPESLLAAGPPYRLATSLDNSSTRSRRLQAQRVLTFARSLRP